MSRHAYIGHMIALAGLILTARSSPGHEYRIQGRSEAVPKIYCTDGRPSRGKGDKRRAKRYGERWT